MHLISMQFYTPRLGSSGSCNLRGKLRKNFPLIVEPAKSFLTLLCILTTRLSDVGNAKLGSGCDPSRDLKLRVQTQLQADSIQRSFEAHHDCSQSEAFQRSLRPLLVGRGRALLEEADMWWNASSLHSWYRPSFGN